MILTQCPVCAAPLPDLTAKQCSRCKTRYCGAACQKQHWEAGGHDKLCKLIKRGGGAEQYNANKKYTETVVVAAEACAEDTKGQTCYICTQALHWKTKEGLVRMCSCRGTAGFAHVSCLAEQAKILTAEAEENNKSKDPAWTRWHTCSLCEQRYHGLVRNALGWACWKTYLGRPETDATRNFAMGQLGNGLHYAGLYEDALSVRQAILSLERRLGASAYDTVIAMNNLATSYQALGRGEDAVRIQRDVHSVELKLYGAEHEETLMSANNYAGYLIELKRYQEAKSFLRKPLPVARRVLGDSHDYTLKIRWNYAVALYKDAGASLDDLREAVETLADAERIARRVFGGAHPLVGEFESALQESRTTLENVK
jgi:tetratricopeptide (TPR) repeat protein